MAVLKRKTAAAPGMPPTIVWRRIEELKSDPKSRRVPGVGQIRQLAKSIAAFGFNAPIVIGRGLRIVAGYPRLVAARELGWPEVPTILLDNLSPAQARAFKTADDRLAESASWDDLLLSMQLKELSAAELDLGALGCCPSGRPHRRAGTRTAASLRPDDAPIAARPGTGEDAASFQPAKLPVVRDGDVWLLGNHRVYCGGACDAIAEMLTEERGAVVFATDPASVNAIIRRWQSLTGDTAYRTRSSRGPFSVDLRQADAHAGS